jgi:hypothetical protein
MPGNAAVRANEILRPSAASDLERIDDPIAAALSLVLALQGRHRMIARECETIWRTLALAAAPPKP